MACSSKPHLGRLALALGALVLGATAAQAATTTATFTVTATVQSTCTVTANNLAFGPYTGTQLDGTTTLAATCSSTVPYDVGLNAGTFSGATVTTRRMTGADAAGLAYSLFQDTTRATNWGETVGTDTVHQTGTGVAQTLTVFGRIPASQFVTPGSYADTITVTLTF